MFPLQPNNDLCFKISSNKQDLKLGHHALLDSINKSSKRIRRISSDATSSSNNYASFGGDDCNNKKKIMHKDLEKQRRQEMANLHASLRFLLPFEFMKGKRSVSDHMNEAVKYIKHLKEKIKQLNAKRDELKKLSNFHGLNDPNTRKLDNDPPSNYIEVHQCIGGIEIAFSNGIRDQNLTLSRVMETLINKGFNVVSCVSTKVNERLLYSIKSEVSDAGSMDVCGLQQKLVEVIS